MYLEKLEADRKYGFSSEDANVETFKSFLSCPHLKQNNQFDLFDYESDEYLVELKTRRCKSNTYPDTMIPINKIDFCKTSTKTIYFFFQFIDGLFFWEFNAAQLPLLRFDTGGRCDRAKNEIKKYAYIPFKILTKLGRTPPGIGAY